MRINSIYVAAANRPQVAMAALIGTAVPSENIASKAETIAAIEFCIKPWSEEAAPAILGKGMSEAAVVCGNRKAKPTMNITIGPIIAVA